MKAKTLSIITTLILSSVSTTSIAEQDEILADQFTARDEASLPLPNGFHPEGITKGFGPFAYTGSLLNGSIYQINLNTGAGKTLVNSDEGIAVGLAYDDRTNYLFVAGGINGTITVYDAADGQEKSTFQVGNTNTFVNDGIVTADAAYFTDSFSPVIYKIPLEETGALPESSDAIETIELQGDFTFIEGAFNSNGIETSVDGQSLLLVNSATGTLFRIDPETGNTLAVDIANGSNDSLLNGDGLIRIKNKLYVVQGLPENKVSVLKLNRQSTQAVIKNTIESNLFRGVATATLFQGSLFLVNARFDVAPPPFIQAPDNLDTEFDVVRIPQYPNFYFNNTISY